MVKIIYLCLILWIGAFFVIYCSLMFDSERLNSIRTSVQNFVLLFWHSSATHTALSLSFVPKSTASAHTEAEFRFKQNDISTMQMWVTSQKCALMPVKIEFPVSVISGQHQLQCVTPTTLYYIFNIWGISFQKTYSTTGTVGAKQIYFKMWVQSQLMSSCSVKETLCRRTGHIISSKSRHMGTLQLDLPSTCVAVIV